MDPSKNAESDPEDMAPPTREVPRQRSASSYPENRQRYAPKKSFWEDARESHLEQYSDEEHKPLFFPSMIVARPRNCFWLWCCVLFVPFLMTILLAAAGLEPISLDRVDEVGLDLPHNKYYQIAQAFLRAPDVADFGEDEDLCQQSSIGLLMNLILAPEIGKENKNLLTADAMEELRKIENEIMTRNGFTDYCTLTYDTCSSTNPFQAYKTSSDCCVQVYKNIPVSAGNGTYNATDEHGCFRPKSPVLYFEQYGDPDFSNIQGTLQRIQETSDSDWANMLTLLDKDFDVDTNVKSSLLSSTIYFGRPIANFTADDDDDIEGQEIEKLEDWVEKKYESYLDRKFKSKPYRVLYFWSSYSPLEELIVQDLSLVFVGIILVYFYMMYSFRSLFISSCLMYQIIMSFCGANLIYRYLWPTNSGIGYKYFALFNGLSIFIILGIGADDGFVFNDTWRENRANKHKDDAQALSVVYVKAGKAMLVTSLTTVISFFSNMSSEFSGIVSFGSYAGLLVCVNYLFVVTYFPSVVYYHHTFFKDTTFYGYCKDKPDPEPYAPREDESEEQKNDGQQAGRSALLDAQSPTTADDRARQDEDEQTWMKRTVENTKLQMQKTRDYFKGDPNDTRTMVEKSKDYFKGDPNDERTRGQKCKDWYNAKKKAFAEFDLGTFLSGPYADFLFTHRFFIIGCFAALVLVFLVFATLLTATPFLTYELLPAGTNFHDYLFNLYTQFPTSASPLYAYIVFGLDSSEPISYPNDFNDYQFEYGEDGSGDPVFNLSFKIEDTVFQTQMYDTCYWIANDEVLNFNGLKIDRDYGVNPQLLDGATSATGGEFGVQCLMDAFARFENVSTYDASSNTFSAPKVTDWGDLAYENYVGCKYCFSNYTLTPGPNGGNAKYEFPDGPLFMVNTSDVASQCDCVGAFPVPENICLDELDYLGGATRFRCTSQDNLVFDLGAWLFSDQDDYDWWKDYIYAQSDAAGDFDRIVLTYIKVQTTVNEYDTDFVMGMKMVRQWDDWVDKYNKYVGRQTGYEAQIYIPSAPGWAVTEKLAPNAIQNTLISLILAYVVLMVATGNYILASLAILNVGLIVTTIFGFMQMAGWGLGVLESILCVLVVGFSVDFTVHLVDTYGESVELTRFEKTREALGTTGVSVVSGACSTLLATAPMLFAQISFFFKFGVFMFLTMFLSLTYSLGLLAAMLMAFGPTGSQGALSEYYGPLVVSAFKSLEEEKEKAEREQKALEELELTKTTLELTKNASSDPGIGFIPLP